VLSIGFSILAQAINFVLNRFHLLLRLLACNFLAHFDRFDLGLGLRSDARFFAHSVSLLLLDLLLLLRDLELRLRLLNFDVVLFQLMRNGRLCDPDGDDFDAGCPLARILLQHIH